MTTSVAPFTPALNAEPIPGYVLKERLGSGGAGEVWKVEAPGGLPKAMKFVYGTMDEKRATQELKSLNRIREVHHPFLLSLERIEVVDGHLIIVSELADSCLKTRFDRCHEEGLEGIPRAELLRYLRETADLLDFIYDKHSLQHLDVKPENLLLVGGHIKVGDFGLLKNINEVSESMVSGLTPLYAPPEVLCGRPSRFSDQYSLAIVFQEMLTGQTPYSGRNTAQLAAQHLHSAPAISALPPSDQAVIARALSKKPEARFASCMALVDALEAPSRTVVVSGPTLRTKPTEMPRIAKTEMLDGALNEESGHGSGQLLPTIPAEHSTLERIVVTEPQTAFCPTLFIGVGGTGNKILRHLLDRLNRNWGNLRDVPAVQMVMLDTDSDSFSDGSKSSPDVTSYGVSTLEIPLRQSKDYRNESDKLLAWLSRRWLFNVPRTQRTEGMRPLGRLAFVDHSRTIFDRLRKSIQMAVSEQSIALSSQHTGLEFQTGAPRIFIVSSLAGGTGGGIVLDLSYAVRNLLTELSLPDENVCGILTHSTTRQAGQRDLAIVNTCATLSEMQHYSRLGSYYPGDAACELPAFVDNNATFHDAYVVHLGDGLSENEYDGAVDKVAEYLFQNVATPAAAVFDAGRRLEHATTPSPLSLRKLRTIGITRHTAELDSLRQLEEAQLCLELVGSWLPQSPLAPQLSRSRGSSVAEAAMTRYSQQNGLTLTGVLERVSEFLTTLTNQNATQLINHLVEQLTGSKVDPLRRSELFAAIDTMFQPPEARADVSMSRSLHQGLAEKIKTLVQQQGADLKQWLLLLTEVPSLRIQGIANATKCVAAQLEAMQNQVRSQLEKYDVAIRELQTAPAAALDLPKLVAKYGEIRLQQCLQRGVQIWIAGMLSHVNSTLGEIRNLSDKSAQLLGAFQQLQSQLNGAQDAAAADSSWRDFVQALRKRTGELTAQMDDELNVRLEAASLTLTAALHNPKSTRILLELIHKVAEQTMRRAMVDFEQTSEADLVLVEKINERFRTTRPKLAACGGASRLILVAPAETNPHHVAAELETLVQQPVTLVPANSEAYLLCEEVEQVPLENILAALVGPRHDYIEASRRLYTRLDVKWSLL